MQSKEYCTGAEAGIYFAGYDTDFLIMSIIIEQSQFLPGLFEFRCPLSEPIWYEVFAVMLHTVPEGVGNFLPNQIFVNRS